MSSALEEEKLDQSIYSALEQWMLLPNALLLGAKTSAKLFWEQARCSDGLKIFKEPSALVGGSWVLIAQPLVWDTEFFGKRAYRLDFIAPTSNLLTCQIHAEGQSFFQNALSLLLQDGLEWATIQVSPSDSILFQILEASGFRMVDTIVGYQLDLKQWNARNSETLRSAEPADLPQLEKIAREAFGDRRFNVNRFNSDLHIPLSKVSELYARWVVGSVSGSLADEVLIFEGSGEKPLGFITLKLESRQDLPRIGVVPLNAVSPDHHGNGIYTKLVSAALSWFKEKAVDFVQIKTQIPNQAVHRCWQKLGARQFTSFHSFHYHAKEGI